MNDRRVDQDEALRRFLRRVWRRDVAPLLRGELARARRRGAATGGRAAAAGGLLIDSLLRLRGRPFTRMLTVMGASLGAMLPDVWSWELLRGAEPRLRARADECVRRRADGIRQREALELLGLAPTATRDDLRRAWRRVSRRWHPDKAPNDAARAEHQTRFIAYRAAYERLLELYQGGALPAKGEEDL
jgi:hypothetical protein